MQERNTTNPTPPDREQLFAAWWQGLLDICEKAIFAGADESEVFDTVRNKFVGLGFTPLQAANIVRVALYQIARKHGRELYSPAHLAEILDLVAGNESPRI